MLWIGSPGFLQKNVPDVQIIACQGREFFCQGAVDSLNSFLFRIGQGVIQNDMGIEIHDAIGFGENYGSIQVDAVDSARKQILDPSARAWKIALVVSGNSPNCFGCPL